MSRRRQLLHTVITYVQPFTEDGIHVIQVKEFLDSFQKVLVKTKRNYDVNLKHEIYTARVVRKFFFFKFSIELYGYENNTFAVNHEVIKHQHC